MQSDVIPYEGDSLLPRKLCRMVTIGWGGALISGLCDRVQERTNVRFSHIVLTSDEVRNLKGYRARPDIVLVRTAMREPLPPPDRELLALLERDGVPTVHNMILGDRVLRNLPWDTALAYLTLLATRLTSILEADPPDVVIGAFDGAHAGIGLAVCRKLGIPWVAMSFTTIPPGLLGFCNEFSPDALLPIHRRLDDGLICEAERLLDEFRQKKSRTYAYVSAHSWKMVLQRAPRQLPNLIRRFYRSCTGEFDRFTWPSNRSRVQDYLRRLRNTLLLSRTPFVRVAPESRFALYFLHMQPESSIDSWEPFFADQFHMIGQMVRALPPDVRLLVKVHISDADNYSPDQLRRLLRLGVALVHPTAAARDFITRTDLLFGIQGTACLEAALLGRPVIMFGRSPYLRFPSVEQAGPMTELPVLVRDLLGRSAPTRNDILTALGEYLSRHMAGVFNDWSRPLNDDDIDRLSECFVRLASFLQADAPHDQMVARGSHSS